MGSARWAVPAGQPPAELTVQLRWHLLAHGGQEQLLQHRILPGAQPRSAAGCPKQGQSPAGGRGSCCSLHPCRSLPQGAAPKEPPLLPRVVGGSGWGEQALGGWHSAARSSTGQGGGAAAADGLGGARWGAPTGTEPTSEAARLNSASLGESRGGAGCEQQQQQPLWCSPSPRG